MSDKLMRFDPATGNENPYPSHAKQWREWSGCMAWLFNPWTGERRHASDVGSDPYGLLILPDGESLKAAPEPAPVDVAAADGVCGWCDGLGKIWTVYYCYEKCRHCNGSGSILTEQAESSTSQGILDSSAPELGNNRVILDSSTVAVNREALAALRSVFLRVKQESGIKQANLKVYLLATVGRLLDGVE